MKSRYLMSCAVAAFVAGAAHAAPGQQAGDVAPQADVKPDVQVAQVDEQSAGGDIIVTATRRNESIQKVPLTIQAFTGTTLAQLNVKNFNDLVKFTPNVTFGNNGPGAGAIYLRGLSTGFAGTQSAATTSYFPNVALYLDDQSMQFPGRNADVYVADLERIEVLEGPQGTLFGGGAQAGAVRYITNKPALDKFSGHFEGSFGGTADGAANASFNATLNLPIIKDKLAVRAVIYDDHHGGYIDNVPGTFTRSDADHYNYYFNNGGHALPTTQQANAGQYNNATTAGKNYNPVDYVGGRISAKWQIDDDWDVLVSESYQKLKTEGTFNQEPLSPDQAVGLASGTLGKLQTVTFVPSYNKDDFSNTAWTVNGKVGDFHLVYTGAYMTRHLDTQQDYTNYSRAYGSFYQCTGGTSPFGKGTTPYCYQPYSYWHDTTRNTHLSQEFRISTPEQSRFRVIAGAYYERFRIYDNMDFDYKSIPTCTTALLAANAANPANGICAGLVQTNPASTANHPGVRGSSTAFGEDTQRGYDQYAFFGSIDFDILHNLTLTGGTRYYHYKEFETGSQYQTNGSNCAEVLVCASTTPSGAAYPGNINIDGNNDRVVYHGFKSRGSLTWKPTDQTTVYGTFSQGFRPGGFNRTSALILPDANGTAQFLRPNGYTPDTLTNWEVGLKTDLLDRKVQLNLSAYYMVWNNVQIGFFNPAGGFGNTAFVTNGADFHIKGAELQLTARPMAGVTVQGGATYNDSKQVSSPCLISDVAGSLTLGKCITEQYKGPYPSTTAAPVQAPFGSLGSSLPFSPHFQGNVRLRYDGETGSAFKWWVSGGVSYTGPTYNQPSTYPSGTGVLIPGTTLLRYRMPGFALLDAQLGIRRDSWTAAIFGENLTNSNASMFTSSAQFIKSEVPVRPLTYGLKVSYDF